MATIFPPSFRTIGSRHNFLWGIPSGDDAILDGFDADFAGMTGGETVDIGVGAAAPVTVTMQGSDTTSALVRDRINATHTGLASLDGDRIVLTDSARVRVTAQGSFTDFSRIGLPIEDRDTADPASTVLSVPVELRTLTRRDDISQLYQVPTGANFITLWAFITGNDGNEIGEEVGLLLTWGNEVDGPTDPVSLFDGGLHVVTDLTGTATQNFEPHDPSGVSHYSRYGFFTPLLPGAIQGITTKSMIPPIRVPGGVTGLRLVPSVRSKRDAPWNKPIPFPATSPDISVAVYAHAG